MHHIADILRAKYPELFASDPAKAVGSKRTVNQIKQERQP